MTNELKRSRTQLYTKRNANPAAPPGSEPIAPTEGERLEAYHEAGHAVEAIVQGLSFNGIQLGHDNWQAVLEAPGLTLAALTQFAAAGIAAEYLHRFDEGDSHDEDILNLIWEGHGDDGHLADLAIVEKLLLAAGRLPRVKREREAPFLRFLLETIEVSRQRWCMIEPIASTLLSRRRLLSHECLDVACSDEAHAVKWKTVAAEFSLVVRRAYSDRGGIRSAFGRSYGEVAERVRSYEIGKGLNPRDWKMVGDFERGVVIEEGSA